MTSLLAGVPFHTIDNNSENNIQTSHISKQLELTPSFTRQHKYDEVANMFANGGVAVWMGRAGLIVSVCLLLLGAVIKNGEAYRVTASCAGYILFLLANSVLECTRIVYLQSPTTMQLVAPLLSWMVSIVALSILLHVTLQYKRRIAHGRVPALYYSYSGGIKACLIVNAGALLYLYRDGMQTNYINDPSIHGYDSVALGVKWLCMAFVQIFVGFIYYMMHHSLTDGFWV